MPAIRRPCAHPGCNELGTSARCDQHRRRRSRRYAEARGSAAERGYDARWRRIRSGYLERHPLCRMCDEDGRTTVADMVDHIVPLKQGGTHAAANLQSLCWPCHARKTARDGSRG